MSRRIIYSKYRLNILLDLTLKLIAALGIQASIVTAIYAIYTDKLGWLVYCVADYIISYFVRNHLVIIR